MDWMTYINGLKEITMKDIPSIIREDLDKQNDISYYGFRSQTNVILFGKCEYGFITKPYLFTYDQDDNACEKLYDMLQKDAIRLKKKYIAFMGETKSTKWLDKIEEKTGWNRNSIIHKTTAY